MDRNFGETRLKDALTDILVPCYDIEHRSPHIFRSRWARRQGQYDFRMSDVAAAASATPTMFDPVRIPRPGAGGIVSLVDGGVFANNPSGHALAEINTMLPEKDDQFLLVSLGTGESMERMKRKYPTDWGYIRWSVPMVELVSESISESIHRQIKDLLPPTDKKRYYRFQVDLPDDTYYPLDKVAKKNVRGLIEAADSLLADKRTIADLEILCETLVRLSDENPKSRLRHISKLMHEPLPDIEAAAAVETETETKAKVEADAEAEVETEADVEVKAAAETETETNAEVKLEAKAKAGADTKAKAEVDTKAKAGAEVARTEQAFSAEGYGITLCHALEDEKSLARPLAKALKKKRIACRLVPLGSHGEAAIHPVISQAAETTLITVIVFSPSLFKSRRAAKQLAWLFSRTLSGENVIVPVIHGFTQDDIPNLVHHLQWHETPDAYLEYLLNISAGASTLGTEGLAQRLFEEIVLWLR